MIKVPRRAIIDNPIAAEAHQYPIGFATLLIMSDSSCKAGCAVAYITSSFLSRVEPGDQSRTSVGFKSPETWYAHKSKWPTTRATMVRFVESYWRCTPPQNWKGASKKTCWSLSTQSAYAQTHWRWCNVYEKLICAISYETLQACASISVSKLCKLHLPYLVNFVKTNILFSSPK